MYYILNGKETVAIADLKQWADWFENNTKKRRVRETILVDKTRISTVFLGVEHGIEESTGMPLVFETMAFSDDPQIDGMMRRASTWERAVDCHIDMVRFVTKQKTLRR